MVPLWAYTLCSLILSTGLTRAITYESARWKNSFTFDHGYVLVWDDPTDTMVARAGTLALYGPDGRKLYVTTLTTPGGIPAYAVSGAIDKDGTVAVVYTAATKPRRENGVALIDTSGKAGAFFATDPYNPGHICFAEDGSIWTAGLEDPRPSTDFMTVRKFSKGGGQAGAYLPFSEVSFGYESTYIPVFHQLIGGWRMRAAHDRVGTIAEGKSSRWLEFDFEGKLLGRWDIAPHLSTPAITSAGAVYAQLKGDLGPPALMVLDKATGSWIRTGATLDAQFVGTDGEDLVYRLDVSSNLFIWVRMRPQWTVAQH